MIKPRHHDPGIFWASCVMLFGIALIVPTMAYFTALLICCGVR